LAISVALNNR